MTESPQDLASAAAGKFKEALAAAKDKSGSFTDHVSESLQASAETQKNAGAAAISSFARSARDAAKELEKTSPQISRLMQSSADTVERLGNDLQGKTLTELSESLDLFATSRPLAFIGCGLLAGIAIGRLVSSPK